MSMTSREQFEAWLQPYWSRSTFTDDDGEEQYRDELVQGAWMGWKAASKASEQQLAESRREFTAANATIHNLELQLADAEARGVELLKEHVNKWMLDMDFPSDMQFEHAEFTRACDEFAAQLRQGAKS
ncbi:TPA: hypothetical protein ACJIK4_004643 [Kluyvera cryocrescens]